MKEFGQWLEGQLKTRGLKPSDLTYEAKIGTGTIYNILNGTRNPGPDICRAIADALKVPPEEVFRRAGLLPPRPAPDAEVEEAMHLFEQLGERDRKRILQTMRAWLKGRD